MQTERFYWTRRHKAIKTLIDRLGVEETKRLMEEKTRQSAAEQRWNDSELVFILKFNLEEIDKVMEAIERRQARLTPVKEHHYNMVSKQRWSHPLPGVTSKRKEIQRLAALRKSGNMSPTLSHWTVGDTEVVGQPALILWQRQTGEEDS